MKTREEAQSERNRERAEHVITQLHEYQRDYAYPLNRLFTIMGDDEEARAGTLKEIEQSKETPAIKYAAAILFKLHDALHKTNDMQKQYDTLLVTLQDPKLTTELTSLIYGMYCNKPYIRHPSQNNLFTKTMYPNQSSAAWRKTVSSLQEHCFAKLKLELDALSTDAEKLKLLTLALKEMHIFFHKEADTFFSDATEVEKYRTWIANEMEKMAPAVSRKLA